jgi:membrane protein implicated in regulation of membrane protease activity
MDEGPVRRVLRASHEFDRSLEEGWRLLGYKHDLAMGVSAVALFGACVALLTPWSLVVSLPLVAVGVVVYVRFCRRVKAHVESTQETFEKYRAVLEGTLAEEDMKCKANGHVHPATQEGGSSR